MKKGWIIAATILVVAGIAVFVGGFAAAGFDFTNVSNAKTVKNTYAVSDSFESIDIDARATDVLFKKSTDGTCSVHTVESENAEFSVKVVDGTLKISADSHKNWYDYLSFFFTPSQSVTVYLPSESYKILSVSAGTGDVTVPENFSFDSAEIVVSTGDVAIGASVAGKLRIASSTGDIKLDKLTAGELELSVSTGAVKASSVECAGKLYVKVSTGKTTLTDVTCKKLESDGSTGKITLNNTVASESIRIERSTGDVKLGSSDAPVITVKTSTGDVTGTLKTDKVFFTKTTTGDISIPRTTSGGECEITTSTGDINIKIG